MHGVCLGFALNMFLLLRYNGGGHLVLLFAYAQKQFIVIRANFVLSQT